MWCGQIGDDLNPIRVLELFSAITDEACELLDLAGRPEHLIMTHLPVPPVCIRPSVEMDSGGGTNEDDITMKLMVRHPTSLLAIRCRLGHTAPDALRHLSCYGSNQSTAKVWFAVLHGSAQYQLRDLVPAEHHQLQAGL